MECRCCDAKRALAILELQCCLVRSRKDSMGRPPKNVAKISVSLPEQQVETIRAVADMLGISYSLVVETWIQPHVQLTRDLFQRWERNGPVVAQFQDLLATKYPT